MTAPDPYTETITDPDNVRMRAASGQINDHRPIVAFLYELTRDHVTTGALEPAIDRIGRNYTPSGPGFMFTNGYLARWAQDAADRLTNLVDYQAEPTSDQAFEELTALADLCPVCRHPWTNHDPEDGLCDAYPGGDHCDPATVVATLAGQRLAARRRQVNDELPDHPDDLASPTQAGALAYIAARWPDATDVRSRALKLAEEAGEVIGAVVKMSEGRSTIEDLETELAQLQLCAYALAEAAGIELELVTAIEYTRALTEEAGDA